MPYHYLVFAVLLANVPVLKLWRDVLLMAVLVLEIMRSGGVKRDSALVSDVIFILLCFVYVFLAPVTFKALNITRIYLLPILIFHVVKNLALTEWEIQSFLKKLMFSTVVLCIYGIVQAFLLGPDFLVMLGYSNNDGVLSHTYFLSNFGGNVLGRSVQRVVSTFSSANVCAFYLCCVLIVYLSARKRIKVSAVAYYSFMFLVFATIVLTFSRSSWLALAIAVLLTNAAPLWAFIREGWKPTACLAIVALIAVIAAESLQDALIHIIKSSLSGSDTSVVNHFSTIKTAITKVSASPFGLGLGENGPRALNYGSANLVESSYFLMVFEYGLIGAVLYFYDYVFMIIYALKNRRYAKHQSAICLCLAVFALIAYFNIPYVQEIECTGFVCIVFGLLYAQLDQKKQLAQQQ